VMRLPFTKNSFDGVYSFDAICHAPNKLRAYEEIARVTKVGAVFLGFDWFSTDAIGLLAYGEYIQPVCDTFAITDLITMAACRNYLHRAGFEVEDMGESADMGGVNRLWDILDGKASSLTSRPAPTQAELLMRQSIVALARAGRAGRFQVGYWRARKVAGPHENAGRSRLPGQAVRGDESRLAVGGRDAGNNVDG
jgi:sterol 24-C-methyltransferase